MPPSKKDLIDIELAQSLKENDHDDHEQKISPTEMDGNRRSFQTPGNLKAISACTLYSFCSVSMILVNKSLASRYVHCYEGSDGCRGESSFLNSRLSNLVLLTVTSTCTKVT
jgi:hypothetical protein